MTNITSEEEEEGAERLCVGGNKSLLIAKNFPSARISQGFSPAVLTRSGWNKMQYPKRRKYWMNKNFAAHSW